MYPGEPGTLVYVSVDRRSEAGKQGSLRELFRICNPCLPAISFLVIAGKDDTMEVVLGLTFVLLVLGCIENAVHQRRLKSIPIRIHVNGTRGKSTTTRLIAGIFRQAGYRVIAKTTGTAARLIFEDGSEESIKRRRKPSVIEQVRIVAEAARRGADVLVVECMAIHPEMQWISERRILQSTIGVITNAREDHLDVMGPTRQDVASVLALAIPKAGKLVVGEQDYFAVFKEEAAKLGSSTYLADLDVTDAEMGFFSYAMFADNVACALKVGELLGVSPDVAWEGMATATPDPGSTQICCLEHSGVRIYFVNALAANDRRSTLLVWDRWRAVSTSLVFGKAPVVGLLHNRDDRSFRVPELTELASSELPLDFLFLTGALAPVSKRFLKIRGFDLRAVAAHKDPSPQEILDQISRRYEDDVVLFAYGNTRGFGQQLVDYFDRNGERIKNDLTSDRARPSF